VLAVVGVLAIVEVVVVFVDPQPLATTASATSGQMAKPSGLSILAAY
jgi:hypothetical protein